MAHPHKSEAHSSSRHKAKAILGVSGGGHAHDGGSHFKHSAPDGEQTSSHKHSHDGLVPSAKTKPRLDKFARGGSVKGKKGDVNVAIVMPQHGQQPGAGPAPAPKPAAPPPPAGGPAPPMPGGGPGGPVPPPGGGGAPGGMGQLGALLGGGAQKPPFARGGKVHKDEQGIEGPVESQAVRQERAHGGRTKELKGQKDPSQTPYKMKHWQDYAKKGSDNPYAKGGKVTGHPAGAATGVGRLEASKMAKKTMHRVQGK
jgi:hypothetical protein